MRSRQGYKSEYVPGPGQYEYKSHMSKREKGHDFGKEQRGRYDEYRVPGPGSYDHEGANLKYGSKQEPSYGFGSRLNPMHQEYLIAEVATCQGQAIIRQTAKFTPILMEKWERAKGTPSLLP